MDARIQRLQALLSELFCYRAIGDGFGALVNALRCSIENLNGAPLTAAQMKVIAVALQKLRSDPVISLDEAVDEVMKLEDAGFIPEPAEMGTLVEVLIGTD